MRRIFLILPFLLLPSLVLAEPGQDESAILRQAAGEKVGRVARVPWVTDVSWEDIRRRATASDQPILIDFTATWCGPCKLLDVMVFTENPVIELLADVVTFQVDIDKPEYRDLKERFGVTAVPTIAWCKPDGEAVDQFSGYVSSRQFLEIVGGWRENQTIDRVLGERQAAAPQDPDVLLGLARRQAERGRAREAEVLYRRLVNLRHGADVATVARGMLGLAGLELERGAGAEARRLAHRARELHLARDAGPEDPAALAARSEGLLETALFQEEIADTTGALATYRRLAADDPRNALTLQGYARAALRAGTELQEATRAALRAVVYSDEDADVVATLAECYFRRGLLGRAIRWQERAIAAAPHQELYREQLARYEAARVELPAGRTRTRRGSR